MLFVKNKFVYYLDLFVATLRLMQKLLLRLAAAASHHLFAIFG